MVAIVYLNYKSLDLYCFLFLGKATNDDERILVNFIWNVQLSVYTVKLPVNKSVNSFWKALYPIKYKVCRHSFESAWYDCFPQDALADPARTIAIYIRSPF